MESGRRGRARWGGGGWKGWPEEETGARTSTVDRGDVSAVGPGAGGCVLARGGFRVPSAGSGVIAKTRRDETGRRRW